MFTVLAGVLAGGCPLPTPTVTSVEPATGSTDGGTAITVIGTNLRTPVALTLNGVAATDLKLIHSRAMTAVTPAGTAGPATIELLFSDGSSVSLADGFTYASPGGQSAADLPLTVTSIEPAKGSVNGGTPLTIRGSAFVPDSILLIDNRPAPNLQFVSDKLMTALSPPGEIGIAPVTLLAGDGRTSDYPPGFEYLSPDSPDLPQPVVQSVSPTEGPIAGGTTVTVQGLGFEPGASVVFGSTVAASTTYVTSTVLSAVTPAHPAGTVGVSVVLADGRRHTKANAFKFEAPPIPSIDSLSPTGGPIAGGTPVTIHGTGFIPGTLVFFGGTAAKSISIQSPQSLVAVTPPHDAGFVDLTVELPDGRNTTMPAAYQYGAAIPLFVNSLAPLTGPADGGTTVTVQGQGFVPGATVLFGAIASPTVNVQSGGTVLTAVSPAQPAGTVVTLTVTLPDHQTATSVDTFTYECPSTLMIADLAPATGPEAGDTIVTIMGAGFADATDVTFGGVSATSFAILSDSMIQAITPAGIGTVIAEVQTPCGNKDAYFTYLPPEAAFVNGLTPASGPEAGGTVVTITGGALTGTTDVTFGGVSATSFIVLNDMMIQAITPAGTGNAAVVVVTPAGNIDAPFFTYIPANQASIGNVSPTSGPEAGGTIVTITGTGLAGTTDVLFGGVSASSFAILGDAMVQAISPPGVGTVTLEVQTPNGNPQALFTYVAPAMPTIANLSPDSGPEAGGTLVTITGSGFASTTGVDFGGLAAGYVIQSDSIIKAITPPGVGVVGVAVHTATGDALSAFSYIPPEMASIGSVSPASGPEAGGTIVTITGTNLGGTMGVFFGPAPAIGYTILSDAMIQAVSPPGVGLAGLTVATPNGVPRAIFTYIPPAAPFIDHVSPPSGPDNTLTPIVLFGSGFTGATDVQFDGASMPFSVQSDERILTAAPPALIPGLPFAVISVTTPTGVAYSTFNYVASATASIGSVMPDMGPEAGGTIVTIQGTALGSTSDVLFGGVSATAFVVLSDTTIQAISPPGVGTVILEVQTATANPQALFTYNPPAAPVIASLTPDSGPEAGNIPVTIMGSGFTGTTSVTFHGVSVPYVLQSDQKIQALAAPGTGPRLVGVHTPTGDAFAAFTYIPPAVASIGNVMPDMGPAAGGTIVTITGTALGSTSDVLFGGVSTPSFAILSDTMIQAISPAGTGTVTLEVQTASGNPQALFTYLPPAMPFIMSVSPDSGPDAGGTFVTITGSGFTGATDVVFYGTSVPFFVQSDGQILAPTAPAPPGPALVAVVTPAGTAFATYTYIPPAVATIGAFAPMTGPEAGGTVVNIQGTALGGTTGVTFGGVPAASFVVLSDTNIQAVSPAGTGSVVLEVQTPNGNPQALFTYIPPPLPTISDIAPPVGPNAGGNIVTITGTGLLDTQNVKFDGVNGGSLVVQSDTVIKVVAPGGGPGVVTVRVHTTHGNVFTLYRYLP